MRDCRAKAETPLHRAAAFGTAETIRHMLDAGAKPDARDMHGDTPLTWASWHGRPALILKLLGYGRMSIHADAVERSIREHGTGWAGMEARLIGRPHV